MELKEYHYVYYSYEEYGRGYIGSRTCKCIPEKDIKYFGSFSDKTFNPTQKIILKSDYKTREEAYNDEIILQRYYKVVENPHFANRAYQTSTKFCISREQASKIGKRSYELNLGIHSLTKEQLSKQGKKCGDLYGKINGKINRELARGIFAMSPEQKSELSKKNGKINYENGIGLSAMSKEDRLKASSKGGLTNKINGTGIFSISPEQRSIIGSKSGKKCKEFSLGIFSLTAEQKAELGKKTGIKHKQNKTGVCGIPPEEHSKRMIETNKQKWRCLITGHISNAGGLSRYQHKRGIDIKLRERLN